MFRFCHQRKYGKESLCRKRDQWKKIHLAIDLNEQQILSMVYTKSNINGCEVISELSKNIEGKVSKAIADGAYDTEEAHQLIDDWGAQAVIPPAITSKAQQELKSKKSYKEYLKQRDTIINRIRKEEDFKTGLKQWKIESGYHRRSLIETCMFRFKRIFGFYLQQKVETGRKNEIIAKVNMLNKMSLLGMPQRSVR
ncbi:MAG: transposase [Gammaproteobacteria bacterium]|nr:transposase [Gammaproteobacteria bacterium]MCW5582424.1 transposase [Gammaproteobacteria bacterium]